MGTNYYLTSNVCSTCGRGEPKRHIGKSSAGWCFGLHVYPDDEISDLGDWEKHWKQPNSRIEDEYGRTVSVEEMGRVIFGRSWKALPNPYGYADWEQFHRENHSETGPNGLVRHKVDGKHCIGHGAGTWDLYVGDFS